MGLYAITIRDGADVSQIPAILAQHGYRVTSEREDAAARYFHCEGKWKPFQCWISPGPPRRFSVVAGRRGDEIVRVLAEHGMFAPAGD